MTMKSNIIFQDIDGPLIPGRMYYKDMARERRWDRSAGCFTWDPVAVGMLNHLCQLASAKIVFNSVHNASGREYLLRHCEFNGLKSDYIHETVHTGYPVNSDHRVDAIEEWLKTHGSDVKRWVVIDDYEINTKKLIRVEFNIGMTLSTFHDVATHLGVAVSSLIF